MKKTFSQGYEFEIVFISHELGGPDIVDVQIKTGDNYKFLYSDLKWGIERTQMLFQKLNNCIPDAIVIHDDIKCIMQECKNMLNNYTNEQSKHKQQETTTKEPGTN